MSLGSSKNYHTLGSALYILDTLEASSQEFPQGTLRRWQLLRLMAQNKCDTVFHSDSLQLVLADYYDQHGRLNEKMCANYRFDSLREIMASTLAEARKLVHLGITTMPKRSTLSDTNARRPVAFFEAVYRYLYASN